jgi:hypothetical protein
VILSIGSGPGGRRFKSFRPDRSFPFIGLRNFLCFNLRFVLWTNVDQLKAKADSFSPFLPERYVDFQF